ncbi:hypothetical protein BOX15_Mlig016926g1, partial [Macrostomum lignano]
PSNAMPRARKRVNSEQQQQAAEAAQQRAPKRPRRQHPAGDAQEIQPSFNKTAGRVLTLGEGDTGQLGLGDSALSRKRPARVGVGLPDCGCVQVVAGGMHTACLAADGRVFTFGCNDECALGRPVIDAPERDDSVSDEGGADDEGSEFRPALVADGLPDPAEDPVVHLSAGDSHTAAVTASGRIFVWGTFRDSNGVIGLTRAGQMSSRPVQVELPADAGRAVKSASGASHVICLTSAGRVFTFGCGEQGQLGRVSERQASSRGGRAGLSALLTPREIRLDSRRRLAQFDDVWAGAYASFARVRGGVGGVGDLVLAWGLNNFYQLGTGDLENRFFPAVAIEFNGRRWQELSSGQHHTVAVDSEGGVFACGRGEYGRLGRGRSFGEAASACLLPVATTAEAPEDAGGESAAAGEGIGQRRCIGVACATASSFCVAEDGAAFSWGMGSNKQLGHGPEDSDAHAPARVEGKQLDGLRVLAISGGGQHVVLLAAEANNNSL